MQITGGWMWKYYPMVKCKGPAQDAYLLRGARAWCDAQGGPRDDFSFRCYRGGVVPRWEPTLRDIMGPWIGIQYPRNFQQCQLCWDEDPMNEPYRDD